MQPFGLHGPRVHIAFIGGIVEDPEFRLWGQLQTDVTHQDADNGKGTCGAPPRQQKSEVWTAPMETRRGPECPPNPRRDGAPCLQGPLQHHSNHSYLTMIYTLPGAFTLTVNIPLLDT